MYTSGSTGIPKGVLISHGNCIATLKCFCDVVEIYPDDILLGFLPLAHVFELLAESVCLLTGVPIGYSSPNTLIDSSTKIMKGTKGDASILRPTCITAVPLILDRICKGITDKINKGSPLQKAIFRHCYDYKCRWHRRGFRTPILDFIIFKKITKLMGGKLRLMISGGNSNYIFNSIKKLINKILSQELHSALILTNKFVYVCASMSVKVRKLELKLEL